MRKRISYALIATLLIIGASNSSTAPAQAASLNHGVECSASAGPIMWQTQGPAGEYAVSYNYVHCSRPVEVLRLIAYLWQPSDKDNTLRYATKYCYNTDSCATELFSPFRYGTWTTKSSGSAGLSSDLYYYGAIPDVFYSTTLACRC